MQALDGKHFDRNRNVDACPILRLKCFFSHGDAAIQKTGQVIHECRSGIQCPQKNKTTINYFR
jgi:hypothetical protein